MSDNDKPINQLRAEENPKQLSGDEVQEITHDAGEEFDADLMTALDLLQDDARDVDPKNKGHNFVADWFQHYVLCVRGDKKHGTDEAGDYLDSLKDDFVALKLTEARG